MRVCPGDPGSSLGTSKDSKKTLKPRDIKLRDFKSHDDCHNLKMLTKSRLWWSTRGTPCCAWRRWVNLSSSTKQGTWILETASNITSISQNWYFKTSCRGNPGSVLHPSRNSNKTLQDHGVLENSISEAVMFINIARCWQNRPGISIDPGWIKSPC